MQRHIYLTHAYFIPDRTILRALPAAAARGVDVRILFPAASKHPLADWLVHPVPGGWHSLVALPAYNGTCEDCDH
ncbi:MAG: phospholipase D-like domain-containing protein [Chloroflexota bacterium]|nr:phospholipase D-like domain-containing protein [Chloroflexota bacterium]